MAVQAPSLSELTNIKPEATINPAVVLDSRDAVHELNQSAQFNAEMKQKRYAQQLSALKDIYQDLGAIQAMPVMQQDRPILNKKMADILTEIGNDPRAALGGPKFAEIQKGLGELRSLSTQSKQDLLYSDAHDKIMEADPSLATPENKQKAAGFDNGPLGHRQKFLFDIPVKFDAEGAMNKIMQQKSVVQPFAQDGFSGPNDEFMTRTAGTQYMKAPAQKLWNNAFELGTDENGQPIKRWATEQFEKAQKEGTLEKYGSPKNPQEFFNNLFPMMWGHPGDIVGDKTSTQTANPFSLEKVKAKEKFAEMAQKFVYDKQLMKLRLDKDEDLLKKREEYKNKSQKQKVGALKEMVDTQITGAIANTTPVYDYASKKPLHELKVSPATLKMFAYSKGTGSSKEQVEPDNLMVSQDGKDIRVTFYKKDDDGNPILKDNGEKEIDDSKTKNFSREEYTARFGKDILGVSATEKEINDDDDDDSSSSSSSSSTTATKKPRLY